MMLARPALNLTEPPVGGCKSFCPEVMRPRLVADLTVFKDLMEYTWTALALNIFIFELDIGRSVYHFFYFCWRLCPIGGGKLQGF
jgi:hypothetical protein